MINQKISPWLDHKFENLFLNELSFAEDLIPGMQNKPLDLFQWIHQNQSKDLLFKSLAEFAPLFPVRSYHNEISCWLSPPPSGSSNAVFIVMGRDSNNKIRSVGGNYFNSYADGGIKLQNNFWEQFDQCSSENDQARLISSTIGFYKQHHNQFQINETEWISRICYTMPVYLLVLEKNHAFMAVAPAIVGGVDPADFSYEKLGEVTL